VACHTPHETPGDANPVIEDVAARLPTPTIRYFSTTPSGVPKPIALGEKPSPEAIAFHLTDPGWREEWVEPGSLLFPATPSGDYLTFAAMSLKNGVRHQMCSRPRCDIIVRPEPISGLRSPLLAIEQRCCEEGSGLEKRRTPEIDSGSAYITVLCTHSSGRLPNHRIQVGASNRRSRPVRRCGFGQPDRDPRGCCCPQ